MNRRGFWAAITGAVGFSFLNKFSKAEAKQLKLEKVSFPKLEVWCVGFPERPMYLELVSIEFHANGIGTYTFTDKINETK